MKKRTFNKKVLKDWIKTNGKGSVELLATNTHCSAGLIYKLCAPNYEIIPSLEKLESICEFTGLGLDELVPVNKKKKA